MRPGRSLVLALVLAGCASAPSETPSVPKTVPRDDFCAGVTNFAKVSDALWRGSQPTAEGFRNLEKAGVKTVINLRSDHDDSELLAGTKLKQVRIETRAWRPEEDDVVAFLKVVEDKTNWPIFVHCEKGQDRTGYCVASYRIIEEDWSRENAIREMYRFHYNPIWFRNRDFLRELDVQKVRERVANP